MNKTTGLFLWVGLHRLLPLSLAKGIVRLMTLRPEAPVVKGWGLKGPLQTNHKLSRLISRTFVREWTSNLPFNVVKDTRRIFWYRPSPAGCYACASNMSLVSLLFIVLYFLLAEVSANASSLPRSKTGRKKSRENSQELELIPRGMSTRLG